MPPTAKKPPTKTTIADDIPLDQAWKLGRRIYVHCRYESALGVQLRRLGATWDRELKMLWVGTGKLEQVLPLIRDRIARVNRTEQVKALGLWVKIPYEAEDIRAAAKGLDGVYDGTRKQWAMPDRPSYDAITTKVREHNDRVAERHAAERAETARLAKLDAQQRAAEQKAATERHRAAVIAESGRTVTGEPSRVSGHLNVPRGTRRAGAEQAAPQPGEVHKLRDGRWALVLSCRVEFYGQDAIDDGFSPDLADEPGWYYRYDFVPVEPDADERADDERQAAERADAAEIDAVMNAADELAWGKVVDQMSCRTGATITSESAGGMTNHGGQIILTADGQCWYEHPGYYDDYIRREVQITDSALIARVRAILAGGTRRRSQYQVKPGRYHQND